MSNIAEERFVLYLNSLFEGPVQFLFHFLLQEAGGFCLLHPGGGGLEAAVVACWVAFVHLRAELLVNADHDHTCRTQATFSSRASHIWICLKSKHISTIMSKLLTDCKLIVILTAAQWSHLSVLRVDLWDVSNSLTQHVHWDLITVLVLPVGCLVASSLDLRPAVSCKTSEGEGVWCGWFVQSTPSCLCMKSSHNVLIVSAESCSCVRYYTWEERGTTNSSKRWDRGEQKCQSRLITFNLFWNKWNFLKSYFGFFTQNFCSHLLKMTDACSRNHHLFIIVESLRKMLLVKEKVERKLGNKC